MLRRLLEIDEEQKKQSAEVKARLEQKKAELTNHREERDLKEREKLGLPPEGAVTEEQIQQRRDEAMRRAKENAEVAREKFEKYREELLTELRTQSDLLRQIAERLGR